VSAPPTPGSAFRISDATLKHLRLVIDHPDVAGTRYELLEPVGRGGMGVVWRALDKQLGRDVALKVLVDPEGETSVELAARLVLEAKVLARLEHPGIVPVHDVGILADGRVYYAMKLVRGQRLDQLVSAGLSEAERFRVFARIGEAVAFAHAREVIHRDLKPGNVMVGEFGEVLVLDWGLAKVTDATGRPEEGIRVGTPGFMAPEQARGERDVDARADVFSLGRLLKQLLLPGRSIAAIVAKATAAPPQERYASVVDLAADVARSQAGEAVTALPEGALTKLARIHRKYRAAVWLVATYAVLRIGFEVVRTWFSRP
jgi:serine/threonine protein kinase